MNMASPMSALKNSGNRTWPDLEVLTKVLNLTLKFVWENSVLTGPKASQDEQV